MSKSQSKSKNPFHLLANPPLPCRIFKLKLHDISISPSRLIPSMKNRLSYVKFEAFRVLSSLATSKNRWESNKRGGEGRKGGGKAKAQQKGKAHEGGVARVQIMQRMTRHRPARPPSSGRNRALSLSPSSFLSFFLLASSSISPPRLCSAVYSCYTRMHHRSGIRGV